MMRSPLLHLFTMLYHYAFQKIVFIIIGKKLMIKIRNMGFSIVSEFNNDIK